MHRQIAGRLTGPVTKWLVLAFWLLLAVGSSFLASKLADVQNNEASSWLPASAESSRALDKLTPFQDPYLIPTLVVYERDGGLTEADMADAAAQAKEFAELKGVEGDVVGPMPSDDGEAMQTLVNFNFGSDGWNAMPDVADDMREIAPESDGLNVHIARQAPRHVVRVQESLIRIGHFLPSQSRGAFRAFELVGRRVMSRRG